MAEEGWMTRLRMVLMAMALAMTLGGCVAYEAPPQRPAAVWVPGHWNAYGQWVRGHWG